MNSRTAFALETFAASPSRVGRAPVTSRPFPVGLPGAGSGGSFGLRELLGGETTSNRRGRVWIVLKCDTRAECSDVERRFHGYASPLNRPYASRHLCLRRSCLCALARG